MSNNVHSMWLRELAAMLKVEGCSARARIATCAADEIDALSVHRDNLLHHRDEDTQDASNWRALINCARITSMGSAGLGDIPQANNYAHLTLNFWTVHPEPGTNYGCESLMKFVAIAKRAQAPPPATTEQLVQDWFKDYHDVLPEEAYRTLESILGNPLRSPSTTKE